jgi:hypothetical protein
MNTIFSCFAVTVLAMFVATAAGCAGDSEPHHFLLIRLR